MASKQKSDMRILVAEDDEYSRKLLTMRLTKWGYEVTACDDGEQAWQELQLPECPRLAILDWMMPNMDGPEVCRRLRRSKHLPYVYAVLVTARSEPCDLAEGIEAGADDYIAKPFNSQELRVRLHAGLRILALQREREEVLVELAQAQKLESIGRLAAGIAHEINTPTQFVSDNMRFLQDSFSDLGKILEINRQMITIDSEDVGRLLQGIKTLGEDVELDYLIEEIPRAIEQSLGGLARIAEIVRSMKEFSHPGSKEKQAINLNRAIETTVTVSSSEWKYVAEVVTHLDENLPQVHCLPGDLNQVFLNLIVNAAHAIGDVVGDGSQGKGSITISTHSDGRSVEIRIKDTGSGIPEKAQSHIFDPFFTTKEVGKGTGQGLAIAHSVIVGKHQGSLSFETEEGQGTTFVIRLPITPVSQEHVKEHEEEYSVRG